jgi:hypothetical protein
MDFLLASLKGPVTNWLQDQEGWRSWDYDVMKEELRKEYALELSQNVTRLENLEYRNDISKFNEAFRKLSSTCKKFCPEVMQKKIYLKALRPTALAQQLTSFAMDHSLQQVMAAAVNLEPTYKGRSSNAPGDGGNRPRYQDPNRAFCAKCGRWHAKDGKCDDKHKSNGGRQGAPGGDRHGNRSRPPRVQEVEELSERSGGSDVEVEEARSVGSAPSERVCECGAEKPKVF